MPAAFGNVDGKQIGEVWYESADKAVLPLLVKWLFTSEKLSIQVHPNNSQAAERGMQSGKEECWYIVSSEPGAVLGIGTKIALDADDLRAASLNGSIETLMDWKPVKAGDYYYIPAGTVHAIGAGITLIEVQQYADITYRLYDYGRPRELHLEDGVAVCDAKPYNDARCGSAIGGRQLVDGPHFRLWLVDSPDALAVLPVDTIRWLVPIEGTQAGECILLDGGEAAVFDGKMLVAMV